MRHLLWLPLYLVFAWWAVTLVTFVSVAALWVMVLCGLIPMPPW